MPDTCHPENTELVKGEDEVVVAPDYAWTDGCDACHEWAGITSLTWSYEGQLLCRNCIT